MKLHTMLYTSIGVGWLCLLVSTSLAMGAGLGAAYMVPAFGLLGCFAFMAYHVITAVAKARKSQSFGSEAYDVWAPQLQLMRASEQALPNSYQINRTTVLYAALVLEEFSETVHEMAACLSSCLPGDGMEPASSPLYQSRSHAVSLAVLLYETAEVNKRQAKELRKQLVTWQGFGAAGLTEARAIGMLDGLSDVMVTVAGMGLSTGLPVRPAYETVQLSNLTKINPESGVVDKEPDGKWIKPPSYVQPHLEALLQVGKVAPSKRGTPGAL